MTKAQKQLEKHGYKITFLTKGGIIATKNQRTFKADTIIQLRSLILKPY